MSTRTLDSHVVHKTTDNRWYVPQPMKHVPYFVVATVLLPTWRPLMLISGMDNTYVAIKTAPGIWARGAKVTTPVDHNFTGVWELRLLTVCEWIGSLFS